MQAYLDKLGANATYLLYAAVGVVFLIFVWFVVRMLFGSKIRTGGGGRTRQPRLGVVDAFDLDRQRQLVLVRRDNVEHLIMIGGPNDVLLETSIVRAGVDIRSRGMDEGAPQISATLGSAAGVSIPVAPPAPALPSGSLTQPAGTQYGVNAPSVAAQSRASVAGPQARTPAPSFPPRAQPPATPLNQPPPPRTAAPRPVEAPPKPDFLSRAPARPEPAKPTVEPFRPASAPKPPEPAKPVEPFKPAEARKPAEPAKPEPPKPEPPKPEPAKPEPKPESPSPAAAPPSSSTPPKGPAQPAGSDPLADLEEEMAKLLGRPPSDKA